MSAPAYVRVLIIFFKSVTLDLYHGEYIQENVTEYKVPISDAKMGNGKVGRIEN
jgi:hypothetical protein